MPPWQAAPEYEFANRRSLSADERDTLLAWLQSPDRPRGDDGDHAGAVAARAANGGSASPDFGRHRGRARCRRPATWRISTPCCRRFSSHDTWVQEIEIKPDNPRVLHHCNMAYVKAGEKFSIDNFITGQVPGGVPMTLDKDVGFKIPAGSLLILQIHYVTTGKPERCKVSVGFRYARETIDKQLRTALPGNQSIRDPAVCPGLSGQGHADDAMRRRRPSAMFAHMHLRGKDMTFTAKYPDGTEETLLLIAELQLRLAAAVSSGPCPGRSCRRERRSSAWLTTTIRRLTRSTRTRGRPSATGRRPITR